MGAACVGPLAALGHTSPIAHCTLSKHDAASHAKKEEELRKQYAEAMACVASGQCTAYGASKMLADDEQSLRWPLISRRGLTDRIERILRSKSIYARTGCQLQA